MSNLTFRGASFVKSFLVLGFLALLILIGVNLVLTNRTFTVLQRDWQRIMEAQTVMRERLAAERGRLEALLAGSAAQGLSILGDWSDVGMPGPDGYSFSRAVRTQSRNGRSRVPAVALTAFARAADRKMAIDAGIDDHLAKPVDAAALLRKVAETVARA